MVQTTGQGKRKGGTGEEPPQDAAVHNSDDSAVQQYWYVSLFCIAANLFGQM